MPRPLGVGTLRMLEAGLPHDHAGHIDQRRNVLVDGWVDELAEEVPATTSLPSGGGMGLRRLRLVFVQSY